MPPGSQASREPEVATSLSDDNLYFDENMQQGDVQPFAAGQVAVYSARCPSKTANNEDAAALIPLDDRSGVLVVADGMGGGSAGEHASRLAVRTLRTSLKSVQRDDVPLRAAVLNGIEAANQAVTDLGIGAATTLAVAEIQDRSVRTYHVGDSMILIVSQRGKVKLQTVSHSPVGYAVEAGVLDEKEALHHEDRHLVSNMIGLSDMRVEIGSVVELAARDTLLLASDGLFDNLHVEEIVEVIRKGPFKKAVKRLAEDALHRMTHPKDGQPSKNDDLTFVAFRPTPLARSQKPESTGNGRKSVESP